MQRLLSSSTSRVWSVYACCQTFSRSKMSHQGQHGGKKRKNPHSNYNSKKPKSSEESTFKADDSKKVVAHFKNHPNRGPNAAMAHRSQHTTHRYDARAQIMMTGGANGAAGHQYPSSASSHSQQLPNFSQPNIPSPVLTSIGASLGMPGFADQKIIQHLEENDIGAERMTSNLRIIDKLYNAIKSDALFRRRYSQLLDSLGLFIIGSSKTELGFRTEKGDLDICLMISQDEVSRSYALTLLRVVESILKKIDGWTDVKVITAIVPILVFTEKATNIVCDLNINNLVGIRNSHLLLCYKNFDWRVKPLVLFIKKWARFQDINSAKDRTICSYALTLMIINYLQCGVGPRPILPSLQQAYPYLFTGDLTTLSTHYILHPFPVKNTMNLGELLLGFFHFYCTQFQFDSQVVCVRRGTVLHVEGVRNEQSVLKFARQQHMHLNDHNNQTPANSYNHAQMFVEEPFNRSNVARSVYDPQVFKRVLRVFHSSYQKLNHTGDPYSIITTRF